MAQRERILSGITPSGELHLGNYFGAIAQHISLQDEFPGECFYFIAEYHALTSLRDPERLRNYSRDIAITYLSLGLDPQKALLFRQSDVPEVTELTWLLSSVTGMGLLERAHSYKDKIANGLKPSVGLFSYPLLMASDILIYQPSLVPVGKDQIQHIEITQDVATYFNQAYSSKQPILRRPEYRMSKTPYVPGIDGKKMSKSYDNTIPLFSTGKALRKRIGQIVTTSVELGQPLPWDSCNVVALLRLFCDNEELAKIEEYYRSGQREGAPFGYGHAKALLAEKIDQKFAAARERREYYLNHPEVVTDILDSAGETARAIAKRTLDACKQACGLGFR